MIRVAEDIWGTESPTGGRRLLFAAGDMVDIETAERLGLDIVPDEVTHVTTDLPIFSDADGSGRQVLLYAAGDPVPVAECAAHGLTVPGAAKTATKKAEKRPAKKADTTAVSADVETTAVPGPR